MTKPSRSTQPLRPSSTQRRRALMTKVVGAVIALTLLSSLVVPLATSI